VNSNAFRRHGHRCSPGGGNAVIRPFQCEPHWRAAGVPTGTYEQGSPHYIGYSSLDAGVTQAVGDAIVQIDRLLTTKRFASLAFSWNDDTKLGGRIFNTARDVRDYIVAQLEAVAVNNNVQVIRSKFEGLGRDGDFNHMVNRHSDVLFVFNDNEEEFYAHYNDASNPFGNS
jgi:hypothetical protein